MNNENMTENVKGSSANPAQSGNSNVWSHVDPAQIKEFRKDIMDMLGVKRWTVRCERVWKYFKKNPEEVAYFDEYYIKRTLDLGYLDRRIMNRKHTYRIGEDIGAIGRSGDLVTAIYLVRDIGV